MRPAGTRWRPAGVSAVCGPTVSGLAPSAGSAAPAAASIAATVARASRIGASYGACGVSEPRLILARRVPGPIFIVGAMGSGTTLVRLVLDSHENIAIPRETGFMRGYNAIRFTPFKWYGNWTRQIGWKRRELDEVMRELYDRLFMRYAERLGKTRWGEKSPLHTWHLGDMARLFPDAQFVGVVRHPAASVASNVDRFERTGIRTARLHWNRNTHEIVRNAALLGDRFAMIRYEDLVLRPEAVL